MKFKTEISVFFFVCITCVELRRGCGRAIVFDHRGTSDGGFVGVHEIEFVVMIVGREEWSLLLLEGEIRG